MGAYLLRHTPAVIRLKSCRRKRRQAARESKKIQGVGGRRYTGEKTGWIGEEWPVAGVPLAPEVSGYGQGRKDRSPTAAVEAHPAPAPETSAPPARGGGAPAGEKRGKRKTGLVRRGSRCGGIWGSLV